MASRYTFAVGGDRNNKRTVTVVSIEDAEEILRGLLHVEEGCKEHKTIELQILSCN